MTLRNKLKAINKLAIDITGYDITNWEDFDSPEEAIDSHYAMREIMELINESNKI